MEHDRHTFASIGLTAALSLLVAVPALANQGSALPCSGDWGAEMYGPFGKVNRSRVQIEFWKCGEQLTMFESGSNEPAVIGRTSRTPNIYARTQEFR